MTRPVLLRPECIEAAGDIVTGVLLSQIVYWSSRMKVRETKTGRLFIAKTREEWMQETGLTLKQYKRAISVLKTKGLIEVKVMKFKGLAQSHLRLLQSIAAKGPTSGALRDQSVGPKGTVPSTESTYIKYNTKTGEDADDTKNKIKTEDSGEEGEIVRTVKTVITVGTGSAEIYDTAELGKHTMKATEILKAHTSPPQGSLEAYWKSRMATVTGQMQYPLTAKERGQLSQLAKFVGQDVRPLIDYVVNHWWKFANRASAVAGTSAPVEPHIGFLLAHYPVAMNLLKPPPAQPHIAADPVQLIAPKADEETPVPMVTPQELADLLAGLKSP